MPPGLSGGRQFAVGYRDNEVPLPKITESLATNDSRHRDSPGANVFIDKGTSIPRFNKRPKVFRKLPFGSVSGVGPCCVDPSDAYTQYKGLEKRIAAKVGTADLPTQKKHFSEIAKFVDKFVLPKLQPLNELMSIEEWLESSPYTVSRQQELLAIYRQKEATGFRSMGRVKPHIKREPYSEYKRARWIFAANDTFKVFSGPIFKSMEKVVYSAKIFHNHSNFIKHVPVQDRPDVISALRDVGNQFSGTDYTAFESHMVRELMKVVECRVYRHLLSKYPVLAKRINATLLGMRNGSTRDGVSFCSISRRMSGDACTSLGNGLTNLIIWAYLCYKKQIKWDGYVEGDDGIFATVNGIVTKEDFNDVGFNIKITRSSNINDLSFCGLISIDGAVIRDPGPFIQKFGWTGSLINAGHKTMKQLLRAKALSTAFETPHCPVIRAIAERALALTSDCDPRFVVDGYHETQIRLSAIPDSNITSKIRLEFDRLYGISPQTQIYLEEKIKVCQSLDFLVDFIKVHNHAYDFYSRYIEYG